MRQWLGNGEAAQGIVRWDEQAFKFACYFSLIEGWKKSALEAVMSGLRGGERRGRRSLAATTARQPDLMDRPRQSTQVVRALLHARADMGARVAAMNVLKQTKIPSDIYIYIYTNMIYIYIYKYL